MIVYLAKKTLFRDDVLKGSEQLFASKYRTPPIHQGLPQPERLLKLNEIAITQMRTLLSANNATTCNG